MTRLIRSFIASSSATSSRVVTSWTASAMPCRSRTSWIIAPIAAFDCASLASSFQENRVPTSDGQGCDLSYNFRPRLEDRRNNTNRRLHFSENEAVVEFRFQKDAADRVRRPGELLDAVDQISKLGFVDDETLIKRRSNVPLCCFEVLLVSGENSPRRGREGLSPYPSGPGSGRLSRA